MEQNHQKIAKEPEEKTENHSTAVSNHQTEAWDGQLHIDPYTVQCILDANDIVDEWQNEQS